MAKKPKPEEVDPEDPPEEPEERPTAAAARASQVQDELKALKDKLQEAEYSKAELAREYREQINQLQEAKRRAEAASQFPPIDSGEGAPIAAAQPSRDAAAPYHLAKMMSRPDALGNTIQVPQDIPSFSSETIPRADDVPAQILLQYGAGDYKIKDSNNRIVGGFNVPSSGPAANAPQPMGFPITPGAQGYGSLIRTPEQRALDLMDEGKRRGDESLVKLGASMLEKAVYGSQTDLASELQKFAAMEQSIRSIVGGPNAGMGGPGFMPSESVQLKQLEYGIESKKWEGIEKTVSAAMERVADAAKEFIPKAPDKAATAEAAKRIGAQPGAQAQMPQFRAPPPAAPSPARPPPGTKAPPGTTVNCTGCGKTLEINQFLAHLPCPAAGAAPSSASPPPSAAAPAQVNQGGPPVQLTPDVVSYLGIMPIVSGYIMKYEQGDPDADPERVGGFLWTSANMPFKEQDKKRLLSLVDTGYDNIVGKPELKAIIDGFNQFPNYSQEQVQTFLEVAQITGIMKPEEVARVSSIDDLAPLVDEFRNHMSVQMGPNGREWICKLLNSVAIRAGKPAPHPEFMKGAAPQKGGRDNL